jgi:hypothetical protein
MGLQEVFVLGQDGNLWHEYGPFNTVPLPPCNGGKAGCRSLVASNVYEFMAADSDNVFVMDNSRNLWLTNGQRQVQVDGHVNSFLAVDAETVYVVGTDSKLWVEHAPFGTVPLPPCSQTSGFGQGFGCRDLVYPEVAAFDVSAEGIFVIDGNLDLWQLGPSPVKIDGNVIDFQPLSGMQATLHSVLASKTEAAVRRLVQPRRLPQRDRASDTKAAGAPAA